MLKNRKIERTFFRCPEVNGYDDVTYPIVDEETLYFMKYAVPIESLHDAYGPFTKVFPYVRSENGIDFVDVYFCDDLGRYERFIIRDGYRMAYLREERFIGNLRYFYSHIRMWDKIGISEDAVPFRDEVMAKFPNWNIKADCESPEIDLAMLLEQVYYSSHRSGPREILYKAGLPRLAWNLDEFSHYDMAGTTPEAIIDEGWNLKMLRVLDRFYTKKNGNETNAEIYKRYSDYITDIPNEEQWRYLSDLYKGKSLIAKKGFNRKLYDILKDSRAAYCDYESFYELTNDYPELDCKYLPNAEEIEDRNEAMRNIIYDADQYSDGFVERWEKSHSEFEYENDRFTLIMPRTIRDLFTEAAGQHNCAMSFMEKHAAGESTILFLRDKKAPKKHFVTVEIRNNRIKQAKAVCNTVPEDAVFDFLIEYSSVKDLSLVSDPKLKSIFESDVDEDLLKYLANNSLAHAA